MKGFHDLLKDSDGSSKELKELDIEQFKKALAQVDSQVKMLPATAQVFTCSFRGQLTHEFREWQDHFCNLCANVALLVGSGCRTRGKLPSRLLQQNEDVWRISWGSYKDQRCRAPSVQTFQVRFPSYHIPPHGGSNWSRLLNSVKNILVTLLYLIVDMCNWILLPFAWLWLFIRNRAITNLLSCDVQVQASWAIRSTGWRANCLSIAWWLGTCWTQHPMAVVFCLCKVCSCSGLGMFHLTYI